MKSKHGDMEGCQLTAVYHFTDGGYVGRNLNGLTMVVVGRPKKMVEDDKKAGVSRPLDLAVYTPKGVTEGQTRNLRIVLVEHQMRFAWGKLDFREANIRFKKLTNGYHVEIPGVLDADTVPLRTSGGGPKIAHNVNFEEGKVWHLGKTTAHTYKDPKEPNWKWSYPANNGAWCFFSWKPHNHGE